MCFRLYLSFIFIHHWVLYFFLHEKMSSSTLYSSLCDEMIQHSSAAYRTEHSRNFYAALPFQVRFDECLKDRGSRWHNTDIKGWTTMPLLILEHCIVVCLYTSSADIVFVPTHSISSSDHASSAVCARLNLLFIKQAMFKSKLMMMEGWFPFQGKKCGRISPTRGAHPGTLWCFRVTVVHLSS